MSFVSVNIEQGAETPVKLTRRALAKQRTRERVLAAARRLFSERGYEGATIRDIAQAAGMSTGAVFASFADKSELFEEILTADYEVIYAQMIQAARTAKTVDEALLGLFGVAYSFHVEQLPLLRASISVSWTRSEAAERRARNDLKHIFKLIGVALQRAVDEGQLKKDIDAKLLAEIVWDVYVANYRRAVYDGWSVEALLARLSDQLKVIFAGARA
ncbi:TetR/AcrR family transcriptional regulator [Caulobacter vibrioides]|uniref:Transcriptional regulator, TetR family n=2 Tax=Caulobacter vibrioides TaxID=155892 RepID=Q9AA74_CAUVC|nr:TetR/AcrR family transcriptional regulator [Caulobacter vibrioides]YP_002516142.1 TetR family transcriptional regulator [Caulobacter vibrioides NA1000]AAK22717.1 transcriptional regulator, TetR family [Caulobacter vibrioides CB15]ACL94234.1 TetR family transcriptional regulator [Caulobacter vibrioides NA1000]ATC27571.1 TetR/AcrR family transcriptional regulator [Caulobacter vibrioides]QXZ52810.1 TetR/AcrR family transcriptional regulator [Caulobacter vibrioides]